MVTNPAKTTQPPCPPAHGRVARTGAMFWHMSLYPRTLVRHFSRTGRLEPTQTIWLPLLQPLIKRNEKPCSLFRCFARKATVIKRVAPHMYVRSEYILSSRLPDEELCTCEGGRAHQIMLVYIHLSGQWLRTRLSRLMSSPSWRRTYRMRFTVSGILYDELEMMT